VRTVTRAERDWHAPCYVARNMRSEYFGHLTSVDEAKRAEKQNTVASQENFKTFEWERMAAT